MAGHSHSANIAHRKGLVDAKRGKLFTKLCRAIYVAARNGGGDPSGNMRLRYAIDKARSFSVPKDNIERSIKKATGELGAENFEEVVYEGYGPGGVAVLCEVLTDNRNRTAGELRRAFEASGGNLGATGCVRRRPTDRRPVRSHLRSEALRGRPQGPRGGPSLDRERRDELHPDDLGRPRRRERQEDAETQGPPRRERRRPERLRQRQYP
jgi:hypothetical protein